MIQPQQKQGVAEHMRYIISVYLIHWGRDKIATIFADAIFKSIFLNENVWNSTEISVKFALNIPINNKPALVPIMAWHRIRGRPLFEQMIASLLSHICVTQPQWVNGQWSKIPIPGCGRVITFHTFILDIVYPRLHHYDGLTNRY